MLEESKEMITTVPFPAANILSQMQDTRYNYNLDTTPFQVTTNEYEEYGRTSHYINDRFSKIVHDYLHPNIAAFTTLSKDFNVPRVARGYFSKPHFLFSHEYHHGDNLSPYAAKPTHHDEEQIDTLASVLPVDPYEHGVSYA
jgi:hypothetical protein